MDADNEKQQEDDPVESAGGTDADPSGDGAGADVAGAPEEGEGAGDSSITTETDNNAVETAPVDGDDGGVYPDDDDEEEEEEGGPSMTLWEHLDELRTRIFYSIVGLLVCMVVTCVICKPVIMPMLTTPYSRSMFRIAVSNNVDRFEERIEKTGRSDTVIDEATELFEQAVRAGGSEDEAENAVALYKALADAHGHRVDIAKTGRLYAGVLETLKAERPEESDGGEHHAEMLDAAVRLYRLLAVPDSEEETVQKAATFFRKKLAGHDTKEIRRAINRFRDAVARNTGTEKRLRDRMTDLLFNLSGKSRADITAGVDDIIAVLLDMKNHTAEQPDVSLFGALIKTGSSPQAAIVNRTRLYHLLVKTADGRDEIPGDMEMCRDLFSKTAEDLGKIDTNQQIIGTSPLEGFLMFMKMSLVAGLVLGAPWISWQIWQFVGVGLYKKERVVIKKAFPFSAGMFIAGALFYLFVVGEEMMYFLFSFNEWFGVKTLLKLNEYIGLVLMLMLIFGVSFQLPIVMAILGRVGIVSSRGLAHYRRYVVVGLFVFAAFVTSPSPVDQVLLALPMWVLFELGILLVKLQEKRRAEQEAEEEEEESLDEILAEFDEEAEESPAPETATPPQPADPDLRDPDYEDPWPDYDYYDDYMYDYEEDMEDEYGLWGRGDGDRFYTEDRGLWGDSGDIWINPLIDDAEPDDGEGDSG